MDKGKEETTGDTKVLRKVLGALVSAYCAHASSFGLSLFGLLESFVGKVALPSRDGDKSRYSLFDHLTDALKALPTKKN